MLFVLVILAAGAMPAMVAARGREQGPAMLLPVLAWMTILVAAMLKFDFRADLDRMDALKALPLRPAAVAAGQLAAPVLVLVTFHLLAIGIVAAMAGGASAGQTRAVLLWAAALAVPFDLLLIGVENFVFLIAPARPAAATPGDLSAMGRHALLFVVKGVVLLVPCGVSAGLAAAAYFAAGRSPAAAGAVAVVTLALQASIVVPLVGWAFRRFDPSTDTPA
jgi:hypothetical protein